MPQMNCGSFSCDFCYVSRLLPLLVFFVLPSGRTLYYCIIRIFGIIVLFWYFVLCNPARQGCIIHGGGGCIIVLYVLCIIFVLIQKIHWPFKGKYAPRYSKYKRSGSNIHSNLYMRGPLDLIVATIISDEDSALTSRASGYICVVFIAAPLFSYFWCDPHP